GGNLLNAGVSIDEIAAQDCVTLKRMRNLVREVLARRMPRPPAEYAALQVSRLNEVLLVPIRLARWPGRTSRRSTASQNCARTRPLSRIRFPRCPGAAL